MADLLPVAMARTRAWSGSRAALRGLNGRMVASIRLVARFGLPPRGPRRAGGAPTDSDTTAAVVITRLPSAGRMRLPARAGRRVVAWTGLDEVTLGKTRGARRAKTHTSGSVSGAGSRRRRRRAARQTGDLIRSRQ